MRLILTTQLPRKTDVNNAYRLFYTPAHPTMREVATLDDDMPLYKLGRRTGFTGGALNGIRESDIHGWSRDSQGVERFYRGKAHLVVCRECQAFGDLGDSGSFVVDEVGRFAGLYLGGDTEKGTGLFTVAEDLFEDIKQITGATDVRAPTE
ncbi:hypothetical protein FQN54_003129 [Arachnomyces sp. PD_36]|nr:hypothetical protein FQN54_003129 [Arachnomyces sp. PD_36]